MRLLRSASSLLLAAAMCGLAEEAPRPSVLEAVSGEVQGIFARSRDAIARIEAEDNGSPIAGTGFYIEPNGILITSYSVGGETDEIFAVQGNERLPLKRLRTLQQTQPPRGSFPPSLRSTTSPSSFRKPPPSSSEATSLESHQRIPRPSATREKGLGSTPKPRRPAVSSW